MRLPRIAVLSTALVLLTISSTPLSAQAPLPESPPTILAAGQALAFTDFICRRDWNDELTEYSCRDATAGTVVVYAVVACPYVDLNYGIAGCHRIDLETEWWRRLRDNYR